MQVAPRILVVEDEYVLAQNLRAYLGRRSPEVRIAPDGERALEMIESFTPDIVVLDYGLPRINGLQTYTEIVRRRAQQIGCVVITSYPIESIAERANALGIHHFLCKPFGLWELQQLVDLSAREVSAYVH